MLKDLGLNDGEFEPKDIQWFINRQKDEGLRPGRVDDEGRARLRRLIDLYARYEKVCATASLVDFGELLLRTQELLETRPELREQYQRRFRHVLVDEFQDTNTIQYRWMRLLAESTGAPFVVGDDDQSIFRWRGARMEHLQGFKRDFAGTRVVRLEQNYRSTGNILNAANAVIAHNAMRMGKNLWTAGKAGEPITLYAALNEHDEADFVIERIGEYLAGGHRRDEAAVLYRSNAQSRVFEEALLAAGIPYRVYGGLRFFERAEIKDALAYLPPHRQPARRRLLRPGGQHAAPGSGRQDRGGGARPGGGRGIQPVVRSHRLPGGRAAGEPRQTSGGGLPATGGRPGSRHPRPGAPRTGEPRQPGERSSRPSRARRQ